MSKPSRSQCQIQQITSVQVYSPPVNSCPNCKTQPQPMLLMDRDLALLIMAPCDVKARNRHTPQRAHPTEGFTAFLHQDYLRFLIIVSKNLKRSNLEEKGIPWTLALREQWRHGGSLRLRLWLLEVASHSMFHPPPQ